MRPGLRVDIRGLARTVVVLGTLCVLTANKSPPIFTSAIPVPGAYADEFGRFGFRQSTTAKPSQVAT